LEHDKIMVRKGAEARRRQAGESGRPGAILGLLLLAAFVLWISSLAVRRVQTAYGTDT
jgi:hypothetical protein